MKLIDSEHGVEYKINLRSITYRRIPMPTIDPTVYQSEHHHNWCAYVCARVYVVEKAKNLLGSRFGLGAQYCRGHERSRNASVLPTTAFGKTGKLKWPSVPL